MLDIGCANGAVLKCLKDLGIDVAICQTFALARRYGWSLAVGREDLSCPLAAVAFGYEQALPFYDEGNLCVEMYTKDAAAGYLWRFFDPGGLDRHRVRHALNMTVLMKISAPAGMPMTAVPPAKPSMRRFSASNCAGS